MEKIIEELEAVLKPKYMNTVFTWAQVKRALNSIASTQPKRVSDADIEKKFPYKKNPKGVFDMQNNLNMEWSRAGAKWLRDLPSSQEWISVKKRLPEKDGKYNVFEGDHVIIWRFAYGKFNNKFITHWQPLPPPPKS